MDNTVSFWDSCAQNAKKQKLGGTRLIFLILFFTAGPATIDFIPQMEYNIIRLLGRTNGESLQFTIIGISKWGFERKIKYEQRTDN